MTTPTLSIIMPVYNAEAYMREAVESILAQTYTDFELIIVEDGSTDNSPEIIESFTDSRIQRLYNDGNKGIVYTRNRGMANARGRYIAPFDADDIAHPEKFAKQIQFLEDNPGYGLLGTWAKLIDKNGKPLREKWKVNAPPERIPSILLFRNYFVQSSVVLRREAIPPGGYEKGFDAVEDYRMWTKIATRWKVWNYTEYLVKYRIHEQGISMREEEQLPDKENLIYKTLYHHLGIILTEHQYRLLHLLRKRNPINNIKTLKDMESLLLLMVHQNKKLNAYDQRELKKVTRNRWFKACFRAHLPAHKRCISFITSKVIRYSSKTPLDLLTCDQI